LPHVVDYNFNYATDRYKKIAETLNLTMFKLSDNEIKKQLMDYLFTLKKNVNIVNSLKNKGITEDIIPILAKKAITDPCNATNPRTPIVTDLEEIYKEAR
jgi:alcohol dehydrogenase class IV